ncbi:unnamed protein product [Clavelina lepadiformis]|uniref:Double-strand break repair protein MRE11 n=1 Tax=Clavelina lepadiformis TaxID=159417 RepID=A0ABP0FLA1_CLALP
METTDENTMSILIATDLHLGYKENDCIRGDDSFNTCVEIFEIADKNNVDFILLGGDLFHKSQPTISTLLRTMNIFAKYCLGDGASKIEILCERNANFGHSSLSTIKGVNFKNHNIKVKMPVFSIHGNHDCLRGKDYFSAIDHLSVAGYLNHFGRSTNLKEIKIDPICIQKGTTKLALYGLGYVADTRLHELFEEQKVKFQPIQQGASGEWFKLFVLHQNRTDRGSIATKDFIPENFIDEDINLIVWGHEHACEIDRDWKSGKSRVLQPGSSIATSLRESESKDKHVAILEIKGDNFNLIPIPLETVRPLHIETIILENFIDPHFKTKINNSQNNEKIQKTVIEVYNKTIKSAISKTYHEAENKRRKPLVRIKVDATGFESISAKGIDAQLLKKVANPNEIIHIFPRKNLLPADNRIDTSNLCQEKLNVEDLVHTYLKDNKEKTKMFNPSQLNDALIQFVYHDDKKAIEECCNKVTSKAINDLKELDLGGSREKISSKAFAFFEDKNKTSLPHNRAQSNDNHSIAVTSHSTYEGPPRKKNRLE